MNTIGKDTKRTTTRIKLLVGIAVTLALAASLLVATTAGAQDRLKQNAAPKNSPQQNPPPKDPPSSFMPVIEEPFEVVLSARQGKQVAG